MPLTSTETGQIVYVNFMSVCAFYDLGIGNGTKISFGLGGTTRNQSLIVDEAAADIYTMLLNY
jgi:hypothetical protein